MGKKTQEATQVPSELKSKDEPDLSMDKVQEKEAIEKRLEELKYEICKSQQDILRDVELQEKEDDVRAKYNYFINRFSRHLIDPSFYQKVYSPETEEISITQRAGTSPIAKKPKTMKLNGTSHEPSDATNTAVPEEDLVITVKYRGKNMHLFRNERENEELEVWIPPPFCIPITADVRTFDFKKLAKVQRKTRGKLYDVIVTDPPWQLATHNPTRGVALGYNQLGDDFLMQIPFGEMQENGYIFIWIINAKYEFALRLLEKNGYELVDELVWVKTTVNRRVARSHGFYLQHGKETCLVGRKGTDPPGAKLNQDGDVLFAQRTGQSQKPTELYEMVERLVPNGSYLEIFGRRNNLRNFWTTIGNEL